MKKLGLLFSLLIGLFCFPAHADEPQDDMMQQIASLPLEKVLFVARDILDTPLAGNEEQIDGYNQILFMWIMSTDKISIELRGSITPLLTAGDKGYLLGAYLAGETFSIIGSGLTRSDLSTFKASMKLVLDYYKANKGALGDVPELDRLKAMTPEELDKALTNLY